MADSDSPADQYARVEIMGHQVIIGRVSEVTRYGVQFCCVEPINKDGELGRGILHGGSSIFRETPLTREEAIVWVKDVGRWVLHGPGPQLPEHDDKDDEPLDGDASEIYF